MNQFLNCTLICGIAALSSCAQPKVDSKIVDTTMREVATEIADLKPIAGQRIVNYNVENLFDTKDDPMLNDEDFTPTGKLQWTEERYKLKLKHLAEAISWTGDELPIIVGLEEVENRNVVDDLAKTAPLKGYSVVHFESPDERGIDVALLVRTDYARVLSEKAMNVPLIDDRTRDILYVELALDKGDTLNVFVDHWSSRHGGQKESEPKRMIAAKVVRTKVDEILKANANAKILIMGDFNDHPTDRSIQEGLGAVCDRAGKGDLFDLMCIDTPQGHGSYNYQGKWGYLDQMIVSAGLLSQVKGAKALWDERLLFKHPKYGKSPDKTYSGSDYKGGYSDHLPVVLQLN